MELLKFILVCLTTSIAVFITLRHKMATNADAKYEERKRDFMLRMRVFHNSDGGQKW